MQLGENQTFFFFKHLFLAEDALQTCLVNRNIHEKHTEHHRFSFNDNSYLIYLASFSVYIYSHVRYSCLFKRTLLVQCE